MMITKYFFHLIPLMAVTCILCPSSSPKTSLSAAECNEYHSAYLCNALSIDFVRVCSIHGKYSSTSMIENFFFRLIARRRIRIVHQGRPFEIGTAVRCGDGRGSS